MKVRFLLIATTLVIALGLVGITLTLAQDAIPAPDAQTESDREAAAAAALELNPPPAIRAGSVLTPPAVITAPLFVGVDDANIFTYLVDPATAGNYPLFDGFQVWGAAFDPGNQRLFFNQGPTLHAWPLNSVPATLGLIKGGLSAANLSMVGLAYHDGTLYASRTLNSAQDPEGIYLCRAAKRRPVFCIVTPIACRPPRPIRTPPGASSSSPTPRRDRALWPAAVARCRR